MKNVRREFIRDFLSLSLVLAETIIKLKQSPNKPKYTYNNVVTSNLNNYEITSSDKYSVLLFVEFLLKAVSCLKKKKKRKRKKMKIFILHARDHLKHQTVNTNGQRDLPNVVIGFE